MNIKILNYGIGNLGSIVKLLNSFDNVNVEIADDKNDLKSSDLLILPGVGTFPSAIKNLQKKKLFTFLKKNIKDGLPVLGICLGMHILSKGSDELGYNEGLSFFSGNEVVMLVLVDLEGFRIHHKDYRNSPGNPQNLPGK